MGSRIFGAITLVLGGVILADILIHPEGTKQAGAAIAGVLRPTYGALLGSVPKGA